MPLDCREKYAKADWLVWAGALTGRKADLSFVCEGIYRFLDETPDRMPFTDWYWTDRPVLKGFRGRSVVGAVFLPLLSYK